LIKYIIGITLLLGTLTILTPNAATQIFKDVIGNRVIEEILRYVMFFLPYFLLTYFIFHVLKVQEKFQNSNKLNILFDIGLIGVSFFWLMALLAKFTSLEIAYDLSGSFTKVYILPFFNLLLFLGILKFLADLNTKGKLR
jgi:hypothetical protein